MTDFEDKIGLEIPAFLRGELPPEDMRRIEALAAENPNIAADIEFQRNLMTSLKADQSDNPASEFGWARLSKEIDADNRKADVPQTSNDNAASPRHFWKIAAAALAVISLGQAGFIASNSTGPNDAPRYVTVSETPFTGVNVAFAAQASQAHVTELLQSVEGEFTSGPSALGLYSVKFASKDACLSAVKTFNAASKVIETVSHCE